MPLGTIAGGIMGGNAAAQTQRKLDEIVAMPGVDVGAAYGDNLRAIESNRAAAETGANRTNTFNQSELNRMLEGSIPGFGSIQSRRSAAANDMLAGSIPPDVARAIRAAGTAKSMEGGYGGSAAGRNLVARDLGLTSLDLIGRGNEMASSIIGSTPMARLSGVNDQLNMTGKDMVALRSGERAQKMGAMKDRAIAPGKTAAIGMALQQADAQMMSLASSMGGAAAGGAM